MGFVGGMTAKKFMRVGDSEVLGVGMAGLAEWDIRGLWVWQGLAWSFSET